MKISPLGKPEHVSEPLVAEGQKLHEQVGVPGVDYQPTLASRERYSQRVDD